MSEDGEVRGLQLRLGQAQRDALAWKETALYEGKNAQSANTRLTEMMHERNLLRRERQALSHAIRAVADGDGSVNDLLDLIASMAAPLREGEGLLEDAE